MQVICEILLGGAALVNPSRPLWDDSPVGWQHVLIKIHAWSNSEGYPHVIHMNHFTQYFGSLIWETTWNHHFTPCIWQRFLAADPEDHIQTTVMSTGSKHPRFWPCSNSVLLMIYDALQPADACWKGWNPKQQCVHGSTGSIYIVIQTPKQIRSLSTSLWQACW